MDKTSFAKQEKHLSFYLCSVPLMDSAAQQKNNSKASNIVSTKPHTLKQHGGTQGQQQHRPTTGRSNRGHSFLARGDSFLQGPHRAVSEQTATMREFCSLFVSAPLHAADTKISHVIGFARQGGECQPLHMNKKTCLPQCSGCDYGCRRCTPSKPN